MDALNLKCLLHLLTPASGPWRMPLTSKRLNDSMYCHFTTKMVQCQQIDFRNAS